MLLLVGGALPPTGGTPTMETSLGKFQPQVLSILRIIAGLLFLSAGLQKWFGFPVPAPNAANITLISADQLNQAGDADHRDGSGVLVFCQPSGKGLHADPERRHAGSAFLFRFLLLSIRWCRPMEPRRHLAKDRLAVGGVTPFI
jgi:hypothetical protein